VHAASLGFSLVHDVKDFVRGGTLQDPRGLAAVKRLVDEDEFLLAVSSSV